MKKANYPLKTRLKTKPSVICLIAVLAALLAAACSGSDSSPATDSSAGNAAVADASSTTSSASSEAAASAPAETAKEAVTLRLADMSVYGIAIFNYAEKIGLLPGYFDDLNYDITYELTEWASGVAQNEAYAADQIDFSSMGNLPAVTGASRGYGTKILAVNYYYDDEYLFVARPDVGIVTIADAQGKRVGTYMGTVTHYAAAKFLESAGLTIDDVELMNVSAEMVTALRNGDIDAGILGTVEARTLELSGDIVILPGRQERIYNYVVGNEAFAKKYPDITVRVLQLINDTWAYALENKQDYIEFYASVSGTELAVVEASFADNFPIKHAKDFDESDYESYVGFVDWMKSVEYVDLDVNPDDLLDLSFVKQLGN
jgi:sulfonate transport system substrate-binding protein